MKARLFSIVFLVFPLLGGACSCLYFRNFCETVTPSSRVVSGKIFHKYEQGYGQYIDVEFIEAIQGEAGIDTMTLYTGAPFSSCSVSQDAFNIGDTLIFSLDLEWADSPSPFAAYDISSFCSSSSLFLENGKISLPGEGQPEVSTYEAFKSDFRACSAQEYQHDLANVVTIAPNPASIQLNIRTWIGLDIDFEIFSVTGQSVFRSTTNQETLTEVDVSDFSTGVYFIRFQLNGKTHTERFVVQ